MDDVYLKFNGELFYLGRALDQLGVLLGVLLQERCNAMAAAEHGLAGRTARRGRWAISRRISAVPIAAPCWGVVLAGDAGEGIADCRVRGRPGVPGYGVSAANSVTRRRSAAPAWLLAKMADTSIANSACRCVAPHNLAPHCAHGTPLNLRRST